MDNDRVTEVSIRLQVVVVLLDHTTGEEAKMAVFLVISTSHLPESLMTYFYVGVATFAISEVFIWQFLRDEKTLTDDDKINRDFW